MFNVLFNTRYLEQGNLFKSSLDTTVATSKRYIDWWLVCFKQISWVNGIEIVAFDLICCFKSWLTITYKLLYNTVVHYWQLCNIANIMYTGCSETDWSQTSGKYWVGKRKAKVHIASRMVHLAMFPSIGLYVFWQLKFIAQYWNKIYLWNSVSSVRVSWILP